MELGNTLLSGSDDVKFHSSSSVDLCAEAPTDAPPVCVVAEDAWLVAGGNGLDPRELPEINEANGSVCTDEAVVFACCCCNGGCGGPGKPGRDGGREELNDDRIS